MDTATLAWVVNGYLLTLAAPLIAFGRAADAVGAVRLTRVGLLAFAVGAAVTGCAGSEELLIAGRMVQGVGASILTATGLSLVSTAAAPGERGRVVGIWAGVGAIGSAAGPLLAGALRGARLVAPLLPHRRAVRPGGALVPAPRARRRPLRRAGARSTWWASPA